MGLKCKNCGGEIGCPTCGEPIRTKEAIQAAIDNHIHFCALCGHEVASTLAQALATLEVPETTDCLN